MIGFLILVIFGEIQLAKRKKFDDKLDQTHGKRIKLQEKEDSEIENDTYKNIDEISGLDVFKTKYTCENSASIQFLETDVISDSLFDTFDLIFDNSVVEGKIKEYEDHVLELDLIGHKNACMVQDSILIGSECSNNQIFVKVYSHIVENYHSPDPIQNGLYTAKYIFNHSTFSDFLNLINTNLKLESPEEKIDKDSIGLYLKDVTARDLASTDFTVALEAFNVLKSGSLTKFTASDSIAKLIIFLSRRDVKFDKNLVSIIVKQLIKKGQYFSLSDEIKKNKTVTLMYLNPNSNNAEMGGFHGIYTTYKAKISLILYLLHGITKLRHFPFSNK